MAEEIVLVDQIEPLIVTIRGQKIMLDRDLARLYGVATKRLNEQVRRNRQRFPEDFVFQLTKAEADYWRSQIATSNPRAKMGLRHRPYAFTEHGTIMAANVLNSPRAIEVGVYVVRAFVKLRQLVVTHKELAHKLSELEQKLDTHDSAIKQLIKAIRQLMQPPPEPKRHGKIGFGREKEV